MATTSIVSTLLMIISLSISTATGAKVHIKVEQPSVAAATTPTNLNPRPLTNGQDQCVPFHHPYCSRFGYNYTISPNPWARNLALEQVTNEFSDFNGLLTNNCSEQLGTFLCFTYFPLCYEIPHKGRQIVLPCKETCEHVHASACNNLILSSVGQWGDHLQCDNFQTKEETENGNCAGGQEEENGDGNKKSLTTTAGPTVATTEGKEGGGNTCEAPSDCPTECSVRGKSTGGSFKISFYTFAAKVTVQSKLESEHNCKHAYQVQVLQQFNLSTYQPSSSQMTFAPTMQRRSIIQTSPHECEECPTFEIGTKYLIAGQYHTQEDGSTVWELPNGKKMSLVSKWKGKNGQNYDAKLESWIANANQHRLQMKAV